MAFPLLVPALITALKALLVPLVSIVLYYVLFKFFRIYGETVIDWAMGQISTGVDLSDTAVQLTGFAAWVIEVMGLGGTISFLMSFAVTRFIIKMVRG